MAVMATGLLLQLAGNISLGFWVGMTGFALGWLPSLVVVVFLWLPQRGRGDSG